MQGARGGDQQTKTLAQAVRYNSVLQARYIILTNGLKHYCCRYREGRYEQLRALSASGRLLMRPGAARGPTGRLQVPEILVDVILEGLPCSSLRWGSYSSLSFRKMRPLT